MRTPSTEVEKQILALEGEFTVRSAHRALVAAGCSVSWSRVADTIDRLRIEGRVGRFSVPSSHYRVVEAVPHTGGSVVWHEGHPFVLDDETGCWVGMSRDGQPTTMSHSAMCVARPAVVWRAPS